MQYAYLHRMEMHSALTSRAMASDVGNALKFDNYVVC